MSDAAMAALAMTLLTQAQSGQIDRSLFDGRMNDALTSAKIASITQQLAPLGTPANVTLIKHATVDGLDAYRYAITWPHAALEEQFALDGDGKIAGWYFKPTPAVSSPAAEDPAITALAHALVDQAQSGHIDRTRMSETMNAALTPATVDSVASQLAPLGKPQSISFTGKAMIGAVTTYAYRLTWPAVSLVEQIAIDGDGKIAGWYFKPAT